MKVNTKAIMIALFVALAMTFAPTTHGADYLMVVDSSGSMKEKTKNGQTKMDAAKEALRELKPDLSAHKVGILAFGHRTDPKTTGCCEDVQTLLPISDFNEQTYDAVVTTLNPRGSTPLAESLLRAGSELKFRDKETSKVIIVVTDGNETCGGDPAATAAKLRAMGINLTIHVVGFGVKPEEVAQLKALAENGGGQLGLANTKTELTKVIRQQLDESDAEPEEVLDVTKLSRVEQALVARLFDKSEGVRKSAAIALKSRKAVATVPWLVKRAKDEVHSPGSGAKDAAVQALIEMAPNRVDEVLIDGLASESRVIVRWAAFSIAEYGSKATVPHLVKVIQSDRSFYGEMKDPALAALKKLGPEKIEEAILGALDSKDAGTRKWAAGKLSELE